MSRDIHLSSFRRNLVSYASFGILSSFLDVISSSSLLLLLCSLRVCVVVSALFCRLASDGEWTFELFSTISEFVTSWVDGVVKSRVCFSFFALTCETTGHRLRVSLASPANRCSFVILEIFGG